MKNIFISYSHKDAGWKETLVSHLRLLERGGVCQLWHDRDIALGMKDFPTALTYAQKAVSIWQGLFPNGHPHLDKALNNLEAIKRQLKNTGI